MIPVFFVLAVFACYILVNIIVFTLYAYDKHTARTDGWRLSERLLIAAALCGPFGAFAAMHIFHHKTRKSKFYLVPVFLIIHFSGIVYLAGNLLLPGI
ncbi:DUF1294 domain-containing protein [Methanoregula sp.]|jgi:uncharacterized membrane protein YsdA (DUF1294 family)|uniref:DUF1294 domain-containing protein n=1 Tax=Methanoregula sp. TaxID=2052170 RepID=UPI003C1F85CD